MTTNIASRPHIYNLRLYLQVQSCGINIMIDGNLKMDLDCHFKESFNTKSPGGAVQQIMKEEIRQRDREHIQLIVIGYTLSQLISTALPGEKEKTSPKYCLPCVKTREDAKQTKLVQLHPPVLIFLQFSVYMLVKVKNSI